jgi:DNA-directed RNA polymerase specialized sigma subunit
MTRPRHEAVLHTEDYAMSQTEIARILGITPGRVSQLEASALRKLRKLLAKGEERESEGP